MLEGRAAAEGARVPAYRFMQVGTPVPVPEEAVASFTEGLDRILVLEELDHVLEDALLAFAGKTHATFDVRGKLTGDARDRGENDVDDIAERIARFFGLRLPAPPEPLAYEASDDAPLPRRPPVRARGCPHRGSFYAVKRALAGGPRGCAATSAATRWATPSRSTRWTPACAWARASPGRWASRVAEPQKKQVAFVGDLHVFPPAG